MCCLINHVNIHNLRNIIEATGKLKQYHDESGNFLGAFEQLFGPVRGYLNKNSPKIQMPGVCPGGMLKLRFDCTGTLSRS